MAREAYIFLLPLLVLAVVAWAVGWVYSAFVFLGGGAFVGFFFRNPSRNIPEDPRLIVSPADGRVIRVEPGEDGTQVSIFLSVFNVHINRAPIRGKITMLSHKKGRFYLAFDERASVENEQVVFTIEGEHNVTFSLIAGLVARRIVPWKHEGEVVSRGERIGLIRFGSRVDILIPGDCDVRVKQGDKVRGGSSILASWSEEDEAA
jgi:phosphatidylserine decarboxylase